MQLAALMLGSVMWAIAYLIIIVRGFRRATYGLPLLPVCSTLGGDLAFVFLLDPHVLSDVPHPFYDPDTLRIATKSFCAVWALAGMTMLAQLAKYGRRDTLGHAGDGLFYPYAVTLVLLSSCFAVLSRDLFRSDSVHFLALGLSLTLVLSASSFAMALARINLRGHSLTVAVLRLVGMELVCLPLIDALPGSMVSMFMLAYLLVDGAYIVLLVQWARAENMSIRAVS